MKLNSLTEEALEQETIDRIGALDYETINASSENFGEGGLLGRETSFEVVLKNRLRKKLHKLNDTLPHEAIDKAIYELTQDRSILNPLEANKQIYKLIRDGVKIQYKDHNGIDDEDIVKIIDWNTPLNNDFLVVRQFKVSGEMHNCRADFIIFVNGLPLVLSELKASYKNLQNAFNGNIKHYKKSIPQLLWYNAFILISNGSEAKIGTITSEFEHFADWKKINDEGEKGIISLDTVIKGVFDKSRLLDLIENFILYQYDTVKIIAKNHQYLGVNRAIKALEKRESNNGKLGVFWHTQGSGKSFSMIFFTQKVLRKIKGNWTFLIVTDRDDLDKQIYKNFVSTGAVTEVDVKAKDRQHLKKLLSEDHRNIFTMIQKFGTGEKGKLLDEISPRDDIIVITDEAHRSQYETLAMSMRKALPNASYMAFTGTPLIKGEEKTKNIFGDCVSIYNFKQSVDDNATRPLYYENRLPDLQIINDNLKDDINQIIKDAGLTEEEEERFAKEYVNTYQLITRNPRLEKIAKDVVDHFMNRGFMGKAMYIAVDKATAVKMYDKVQNYWKTYLKKLEAELNTCKPEYKEVIKEKIKYMKETDMAVIVSPSQNEIEDIKKKGADITPHRLRMNRETNLDEQFKDPKNCLRIVFVCAMWVTGFDAPSVSTLYLDKILKDHTLMQTMARANRVWQDKPNGLIVDYIGIFRHLQKALAIYGVTDIEDDTEHEPIEEKQTLLKLLDKAFTQINNYCTSQNIDLLKIFQEKDNFKKIHLLDEAVESILEDEKTKNAFSEKYSYFKRLYKAIMPDIEAEKYLKQALILAVINEKINIIIHTPIDTKTIKDLAEKVETLLDESISIDNYQIIGSKKFDLTKVNFEELKERFFNKDKQKTIVERLKANIHQRLHDMLKMNKLRIDYLEKYQKLIDDYNAGEIDLEQIFLELVHLSRSLDEEEQRHMKENLTEEELVVFDILTKPEPKLSKKEIDIVKETAKELLAKLKKERLVIVAWRNKQSTRAKVLHEIEEICDKNLPEVYEEELFKKKCHLLYEHFYDNYPSNKHIYYEQIAVA